MTARIYIQNYDPLLLRKKLSILDEYFRKQETVVELVSPDGLFTVENGNLYKMKSVDKEIITNDFEGCKLLIDSSYFEKEPVYSQIPYDHINLDIVKFYYSQEPAGKIPFIRLVVEGLINKNNDKPCVKKYDNFTPTNFYFLANESFENVLVKKELNVFLSMLN